MAAEDLAMTRFQLNVLAGHIRNAEETLEVFDLKLTTMEEVVIQAGLEQARETLEVVIDHLDTDIETALLERQFDKEDQWK